MTINHLLDDLITAELADLSNSPWGITKANFEPEISARSKLFASLSPEVVQLCQSLGFREPEKILVNLWTLWLPLAIHLGAIRKELGRTLIQGVLGGQGTGKSTLAVILRLILGHLGYSVANLSLDDLYLTYLERQKLQQQDPRVLWRGPPGTHNVDLGLQVLERCLQYGDRNSTILMPRFDKSAFKGYGDRTLPEAIPHPDIVLFEGWFVGVQPIEASVFAHPPAPINNSADRQFAKDINQRLSAYLPLWSKLDRLIVLYPLDYHFSKQWRKEAEQKMIAAGKAGMSDEEIDRFVDYFWRSLHPELFIKPLINNPNLTDLVIEIESNHNFRKVYKHHL
jgi:D-glycerate 3-kinase